MNVFFSFIITVVIFRNLLSFGVRRFCVTEENRVAEYFKDLLGPPIHLADELLRRALNIHYKSRTWHFTRNTFLPRSDSNDSKALKSLKKENARFMFSVKVIFMMTFIFELFITTKYVFIMAGIFPILLDAISKKIYKITHDFKTVYFVQIC